MAKSLVRLPYVYDAKALSSANALICEDETKTQQQFRDETDINNILEQFGVTGDLPQAIIQAQSGDFTGVTNYHEAMNLVVQTREEFMTLPAKVRDRFNNDPQKMLDFIENDSNYDEAIKLGLVPPKPISQPGTGEKGGAGEPGPAEGQ